MNERRVTYRASAVARCPDGTVITLGGRESGSPRRALRWLRSRAEHVAEQLGAPCDTALRARLDDDAGYQWALYGLVADIPFAVEVVDGDGCVYTLAAHREAAVQHPRVPASYGREVAWPAA
ncbi:hypothetical protein [Streptomyces sp. NPDC048650]|uniref:hypothetical protein n=1 Tax=unclassified Streptomyces TaxID=2593676 RepID=UPI003717F45C